MQVDHLSLSTTPVKLLKGGQMVSTGTGFYFIREDGGHKDVFLVTNHHVLTGSAPGENKSPIGDRIDFQFHESDVETGRVRTVEWPLFTKDGRPTWINSTTTPDADLAIIPIPGPVRSNCVVKGIASHWANPILKVRPTTPVTLIGYPYGLSDAKNALPIWKTGAVASEPDIDFDGKPLVLIDVAAFPGMSGSPAFAVSLGMYELPEGGVVVPGTAHQFLGIFASLQVRNTHQYLELLPQGHAPGIRVSESLQIGHIWKARLVLETIDAIDVKKYEEDILKNLA